MIKKERKLRKLEDEEWRVLPNSNKLYQVSNYGRIKSFAYNKKDGKILKFGESKGFFIVPLSTIKENRKFYVHKVVAEVWISKPSANHSYVTHLDGMFKNNHISNLEWHTKESLREKHVEYLRKKKKNPNYKVIPKNSKLNETDIELLKTLLLKGVVQAKIAKLFRISEMQVTRIKRGENWGHVKVTLVEE